MLGEFEIVEIGGEKLVRVRLSEPRSGVARHSGGQTHWIFDEVVTEAVALRLSFYLWRDVTPCWMRKVDTEVRLTPLEALMQECGAPMTRDEYIRWNTLGRTVNVSPEEEAELPNRFQRSQPRLEHDKAPKDDRVDQEVLDELARYQKVVGRELTAEELEEIQRSPKMRCWIRWCKSTHEHNKKQLIAEGWVPVEYKPGNWRWERKQ